MKARVVATLGLLLFALISLPVIVQGFGGAITPPKIYIEVNASKGLPQEASAVIRIKNTNDFPVMIQLIPEGEIVESKDVEIMFSKNNFTMQPHADDRINVTFKVKKVGTYNGTIITKFNLLGNESATGATMKPSIALSSDVMVKVTGKPPGLFRVPGFEIALALIAVVVAVTARRCLR